MCTSVSSGCAGSKKEAWSRKANDVQGMWFRHEEWRVLTKNVVYCNLHVLHIVRYVGETERPVRWRFQEHFRDAKARAVKSWKHHGSSLQDWTTESAIVQQHLSAVPSGEGCWKGVSTYFAQILGSDRNKAQTATPWHKSIWTVDGDCQLESSHWLEWTCNSSTV